MAPDPRLRSIAIFEGLGDDDLERICRGVTDVQLAAGEVLFAEGDTGDVAYVLVDGEVEVLKATSRRDVRIAMRGPGDVVGEIALLYAETRSATVRARTATSCLAIPKAALDELLETSPVAARRMFHTLGARLRETHQETQQSQRMAQLGTLAVGIAHELNNPAAGVQRAAQQLREELDRLANDLAAGDDSDPATAADVASGRRAGLSLLASLDARRVATASRSALERTDLEDDLEQWLADRGVDDAWEMAAGMADVGVQLDDLPALEDGLAPAALTAAIRFVVSGARLRLLTDSIVEGTSRMSAIVGALKRHNFTDQAPVVAVDVARGIEDTILLLGHKVKRVRVVREYADDLPTIEGYGSDLNQAWTNLIDNACDALLDAGTEDPTITIRVSRDGDTGGLVVAICDNGPGIPAEHRERIFDAFWTSKEPGRGTGLGLQITMRIVLEHDGELTLESAPGSTCFRVALPERLSAGPSSTAASED